MLGLAIVAAGLMSAPESMSDLTVFAAASLKDAFAQIGSAFERKRPGVKVRFSFAGSQTLAAQILHGAPADVFASANWQSMTGTGIAKEAAVVFARNRLILVARKGWRGLKGPAELSKGVRLVIADERVPAGKYTLEFLDRGAKEFGANWRVQVLRRVVSREADVRSVLAKVQLGEADAGIVYASDAIAAKGKVLTVPIPPSLSPIAEYPIGPALGSTLGKAFIAFVLSRDGQKILASHGFLPPGSMKSVVPVVRGDGKKPVLGRRTKSVMASESGGSKPE